jgi:hypothetical protein
MPTMANPYSTATAAANYLHEVGRHVAKWYAGITDSPSARLHDEHLVDEHRDEWAYCECIDDDVARDAPRMLLSWGYQGGPGGGSEASVFVYVYKVSASTCEDC